MTFMSKRFCTDDPEWSKYLSAVDEIPMVDTDAMFVVKTLGLHHYHLLYSTRHLRSDSNWRSQAWVNKGGARQEGQQT